MFHYCLLPNRFPCIFTFKIFLLFLRYAAPAGDRQAGALMRKVKVLPPFPPILYSFPVGACPANDLNHSNDSLHRVNRIDSPAQSSTSRRTAEVCLEMERKMWMEEKRRRLCSLRSPNLLSLVRTRCAEMLRNLSQKDRNTA